MRTTRILTTAAMTFALICLKSLTLHADQNNFQILPAPIAYPFFEPGRTDFKMSGVKFGISGNNIDLSGAGGYFIGRHAMNEYVALDGMLGVFGANGDMPGFALPFVYSGSMWSPVIEGKGRLTGFGAPFALNLEVQLFHKPFGSFILFAGPNMSIAGLNLDTPYHARSGVTNAASTTFNTKSTVVLGGAQVGAQAGINLGPFTIAPFYMIISQSGSASFTFNDGYKSTDQLQGTATSIEPFLITATGADLIYRPWGLSIGTLIQSAGSTTNQEGYKIKIIQLTWHFRTK